MTGFSFAPRPVRPTAPPNAAGPQRQRATAGAEAQQAAKVTLSQEERGRFESSSPLRRPRASLGPRPAAPSMRPRSLAPSLEELQLQRSAELQMSAEFNDQSLYALLGASPDCSDEELRLAYRLALSRFHPEGLATYGVYSRAQAAAITDQIEEAYLRLSDPNKRRSYDSEAFPEGVSQRSQVSLADTPSRFLPLIPPEATAQLTEPLRGATLKRLRIEHSLTLEVLHERTKITLKNLKGIEDEDAQTLPANVYLKGFLQQIARAYSLPEAKLCAEYLALISAKRAQA